MTKTRRRLLLMVMLITLLAAKANILSVKAADTKGPVISYVDVQTYKDVDITAGKSINYEINVKDPSGISDVVIVYKKVNDEGFMRLKAYKVTGNNDYEVNQYSCDLYIDKYAESGKYHPYLMFVYDGSPNKNRSKYVFNLKHECFYTEDKKSSAKIDEIYLEVKQPKKYKITEFNAKSFEEDYKSVKKDGTIVVKGSMNNGSAATVLPAKFLQYVKKQNLRVIIPDWCGASEIVIKGNELTNAQTKKELSIYIRRQDLKYGSLGSYGDEMYHEVSVKMSNKNIPLYLWITPSHEYLDIKGTYPTTISKIVKNSSGKITKVTPILKKAKFNRDNTVRKTFTEGIGSEKVTYAVSSKNMAHDFTAKVVKKATFSKNGQVELTCKKCGEVYYDYISKAKTPELSCSSYLYNGNKRTPAVTVKDGEGSKLKKGTDYTVSYDSGRTKVGKYAVTVTLKGNYTGTKKVYFTISLKAPKNVKAKLCGYNDVELSWDKLTGADGYMIYRFDPWEEDSDKQYKLIGSTAKTTYKAKDLDDDTTYQFVVKAYVKDGNSKVLSDRSDKVLVNTMGKIKNVKVSYGGGSSVSVEWDGINECDRYQISCSSDESTTNIVATIGIYNTRYKYTPEKNKKMYYKVRAYLNVDGKKIYTPWSSVKAYTLTK